MKRVIGCLVAAILALYTFPAYAQDYKNNDNTYEIVDSHLHYLSFLQETDGFERLAEKLDEAHVSSAVVFGMAMAKEWDEDSPNPPSYYLSNDARCYYYSATDYIMMTDYLAAPEHIQERFYPFICGANTTDIYAADHLRRLLETYPGKIYGIGELMNHHDDLTALTYGEAPRPNNQAMKAIYDLAAEYGLPVLIHNNIGPSYTDDPIYLDEMKEALEYNPETTIIWAHVGISRRVTISNLTIIADEMLSTYPNLYYDISWVVFDDYINASEESLDEWADLIEKYPDRFMIGSDAVGHFDSYEKEITKYYPLLHRLSDETQRHLCEENILRLIHVREEVDEIAA